MNLMNPYNKPERISSDQGGSVSVKIPYVQRGIAASKIATAYTFIPCDLDPQNVFLTPVKLSTVSANGIALFTTVVGWQIDDLDTLSAASDLDAWAQNVAYNVGTIVKNAAGDALVCVTAHTSTTGGTAADDYATDYAAGYWQTLTTTAFIKITHTSAGSGKVANFNYEIHGYKA